jgi:hypothetical protein
MRPPVGLLRARPDPEISRLQTKRSAAEQPKRKRTVTAPLILLRPHVLAVTSGLPPSTCASKGGCAVKSR